MQPCNNSEVLLQLVQKVEDCIFLTTFNAVTAVRCLRLAACENLKVRRSQRLPLKFLYCSQFSTIIGIGQIVLVVLLLISWLYLRDT